MPSTHDTTTADAEPGDCVAMGIPGGVTNADELRTEAAALIGRFVTSGHPTAVICHCPWSLVTVEAAEGRCPTSWPSLRTDPRNAGAGWVDEEVVVDGNPITSRAPQDLPAFRRVSDPADMTMIVPVRCPHCHTDGTLVVSYGPGASAEDSDVMLALSLRPSEATMAWTIPGATPGIDAPSGR